MPSFKFHIKAKFLTNLKFINGRKKAKEYDEEK